MASTEPTLRTSADPGSRKADHLRIAAGPGVLHRVGAGLDEVRLRHRALPGRDLADVDLTTTLLGKTLQAPMVISAMTGGTDAAAQINERLAEAAAEHGIGMTLGSGRRLLDDPGLLATYARHAPRPPLLLANLGVVQLLGADGVGKAGALVELLDADGLSVHLNALQEAVQPEGEAGFAGAIEAIARVVTHLAPLPVIIKEVGFGMDAADVAALCAAGVAAVDVAGAGGTNWALVEGRRDAGAAAVAEAFADWGVPTATALRSARATAPALTLVASGGVRNGVDVARCLALGATAAGMARPLLVAAQEGRASDALATAVQQLRIATWLTGAASTDALGEEHVA